MNKSETIREAKIFLNKHYEELNKAFDNFLHKRSSEEINKRLKKINEYICFCEYKQLFVDNTEITSLNYFMVFKNFIFIYHEPYVLLCNESKHNRFKITYYRGGYIIPIEEFHCSGEEVYCYTKPSLGQIGIRTEKDLQDYLIDKIEGLDGWECFRLSPMKYGKGVPDVLVKKPNGEPVYIELKTPQGNGVLTTPQIEYHEKLRNKGKTVKILWKKEQVDKFLENEIIFDENKTEEQNCFLFKSVKELARTALSYLTIKKKLHQIIA